MSTIQFLNPQFLISGFLLLVLLVAIRRRYSTGISDIPGPFLASFSVVWQIWHIIKGDIEWQAIRLHERHGHFVRISHKEVSVSHPEAIRMILLAPLRKADWYKVMALPDQRYQTPMSEVDPKRQVARAKNVAAGYTLTNLLRSEKYVDESIQLLEKRLGELADGKKPVEFNQWFNYMAFDIVGDMAFSSRFGFLETGSDIGGSIENTRVLTLYTAIAGFFLTFHGLTLGNPWISKLNLMPTQHIFDTTLRAIDKRRQNPEARFDMLEHWMQMLTEHPERMEENELYGVTNATIGAGADTISATLQAFFYHMIRHPKHLDRARNEVLNQSTSKVVSYAEAQNLPFLQACIKETQRMHPAVAFGLPRVVPKGGLTIGSHRFTEGTILSVNPWVMHRSKEFFGEDADDFNPERWLEDRSRSMERFYIPFGAGHNSCPGRNLAGIELSKVTATLLRDFDIRQIDPKQSWKYESHFTAVPYGWPCYVTRRDV